MTDKRILIIDDDQSLLGTLRRKFEGEGCFVQTVTSGKEALAVENKELFSVILIDLRMPEMEGLELCRRLRQTLDKAKIYAMTGYPSKYEFAECIKAGFDGYFTKPFNFKVLMMTVAQAFDEHSKAHQPNE